MAHGKTGLAKRWGSKRRRGYPGAAAIVSGTPRLALALLCCICLHVAEAREKLLPVDEAVSRPDFFTFRAHLQAALARHDVEAVLLALDPDIRNSFGGDGGVPEFRESWNLDSPASPLWETLATVLALGGTFDGDGSFAAPYVFSAWPDEADSFSFLAVLGTGVRVHAGPDSGSGTVATLSYDIVEVGESGPPEGAWVQVLLPGGASGYLSRRYVRSPLDYRALFTHTDGQWRLSALVAGD